MIFLISLLAVTPFKADRVEILNQSGERIVYLLGNVEIEQEKTIIQCLVAQLNETRGYVFLKDNVFIKDENGEIKANSAIYFFDKKFSVLTGDVKLISENEIISADSLEYEGEKRIVRMFKNVMLEDTKNKVISHGEEGFYDLNAEIGSLKKEPRIKISRADKMPITILAREFLLKNKENLCFGYDSVVVFIDSITIYCDTLSYDFKKETGCMTRPSIFEKNNELRGIDGEFGLSNKNIDYFKVSSGIASYWTNDGAHNIIEGESINILFQEGRAFRIKVEGNPKGKLYLKEQKENAGD